MAVSSVAFATAVLPSRSIMLDRLQIAYVSTLGASFGFRRFLTAAEALEDFSPSV